MPRTPQLLLLLTALALAGCGEGAGSAPPDAADDSRPQPDPARSAGAPAPAAQPSPRSSGILADIEPWTGDLDGMRERRLLRVATTFSRSNFFLDDGRPRGLVYETVMAFEKAVNASRPAGTPALRVVFVPLARDELLPALLSGHADLAAARLTVTEARREQVAFSRPLAEGVRELVVSGPGAPELQTLDDLSGQPVHVRASSSYAESLERLSRDLEGRGLAPVEMHSVDEILEAEDILELVASGSFTITVLDDYLAELWSDLLPDLTVHDGLVLREGAAIAWAFRPGSPQLAGQIDAFAREHRQGTLFGNIMIKRYLRENQWVTNALGDQERGRLESLRDHFVNYAGRYELDWLLTAAQAYQESGLDHSRVSSAGAVGIMQIKPETAADPNVGIPDVGDEENNIHAGVKYVAFLRRRYFSGEDLDPRERTLFALAAYNAGPARVRRLRQEAAAQGLDPDRWQQNVEQLAPRETQNYVRNILKYYVAYREYFRGVSAAREKALREAG